MLLPKLLIDLSDLRDQRDAGQLTNEQYEQLKQERRDQFRRDEAEQFEQQIAEAVAAARELEADLATERWTIKRPNIY